MFFEVNYNNPPTLPLCVIFREIDILLNYGSHQKWCEILRKNVLSRVVHAISDVIRIQR